MIPIKEKVLVDPKSTRGRSVADICARARVIPPRRRAGGAYVCQRLRYVVNINYREAYTCYRIRVHIPNYNDMIIAGSGKTARRRVPLVKVCCRRSGAFDIKPVVRRIYPEIKICVCAAFTP